MSEEAILERNLQRARDFGAQFPNLEVKVTGFQRVNAYAVCHDKQTGKGFTAAWYETKNGPVFKCWWEHVGDLDSVDSAISDLKKVYG